MLSVSAQMRTVVQAGGAGGKLLGHAAVGGQLLLHLQREAQVKRSTLLIQMSIWKTAHCRTCN